MHSRSAAGSGCPVCSGKQVVVGVNDLATLFPQVAAQWDYEKNGTLTPQDVTAFSNRKVWQKYENNHSYATIIFHKTAGSTDCPYCTNSKVLPSFNDLETKEPAIAAQRHPELNEKLTPQMATAGSKKGLVAVHRWSRLESCNLFSDRCR